MTGAAAKRLLPNTLARLAVAVLAVSALGSWGLFRVVLGNEAAASEADPAGVVRRFVDAFNAQDVQAMTALAAEDIRWMSVSGEGLTVEAAGRKALRSAMREYFESLPSARAELLSARESGPFVQAVERASWTAGGIERSQCSAAVYEVADGRIRNVWYFPAYECP